LIKEHKGSSTLKCQPTHSHKVAPKIYKPLHNWVRFQSWLVFSE